MWKGFRHLKNPITSSKNFSSKIKAVERYYKFFCIKVIYFTIYLKKLYQELIGSKRVFCIREEGRQRGLWNFNSISKKCENCNHKVKICYYCGKFCNH